MSITERCDEIIRLIDEVIADHERTQPRDRHQHRARPQRSSP
jgi:hypothetical protein